MGFKMNKPSMAISYGGESVQKHKSNLMNDNPVAKHASAVPNLNKGYGSSDSMAKMAKPDYIDIDNDGNEEESMKQAASSLNMNGSPFHETNQKSLPSYDKAYDAQSDEKKKTQTRAQFKKEAKAYNAKKYGTTEPSKDSKKAGVTREQLADNKKTSDTTKSFDKKVVKSNVSTDKQSSSPDDADTRKGRKKMKNTDKASGKFSRKEIKSRKIQRKAQDAADRDPKSKKAIRLKKRESDRKKRLAKNK
tara:strand:+ start:42 stop:785 length:744 start_codon:yes stop_codon:yes gene_type:complete